MDWYRRPTSRVVSRVSIAWAVVVLCVATLYPPKLGAAERETASELVKRQSTLVSGVATKPPAAVADAPAPIASGNPATTPYMLEYKVLQQPGFDMVGYGFNTLSGALCAPALEFNAGEVKQLRSGAGADSYMGLTENVEQFERSFGLSAYADVKGFGWSMDAKLNMSEQAAQSRYAMNIVARTNVMTHSRFLADCRLSSEAAKYLETNGAKAFYKMYGDGFIVGVKYGGELFGAITVKSASETNRSSVKGSINGSYLGAKAGLEAENIVKSIKGSSDLSINVNFVGAPATTTIPRTAAALDKLASEFGKIVNDSPDTAAALSYIVISYASLAEVNGAVDTAAARAALSDLRPVRQHLKEQVNNLRYILANKGQFPDLNDSAPTTEQARRLLDEGSDRLDELDEAIVQLVADPQNAKKPSAKEIAKFETPWKIVRSVPVARDVSYIGGWPLTNGDNDVNSQPGRHTRVEVSSRASHDRAKVSLSTYLYVREMRPDNTTFTGRRIEPIYSPPPGWRIRQIDPAARGSVIYAEVRPGQFHGAFDVATSGSPWESMKVQYDGRGDDQNRVGVKGRVSFNVQLIEE